MYEFVLGVLLGAVTSKYYLKNMKTFSDATIQVDEFPSWPAPPKPILIPKRY
jgi:hypothetical protein